MVLLGSVRRGVGGDPVGVRFCEEPRLPRRRLKAAVSGGARGGCVGFAQILSGAALRRIALSRASQSYRRAA